MKNSKGFTLIELLMVTAIMAVLMSILLPAIGYIMVIAEKTKNQSFVNDIETGIKKYKMAKFVPPYAFPSGTNRWISIQDVIRRLNPGNGILTAGATPSSDEIEDFFDVPPAFINSDGEMVDTYGNEHRIKFELNKPLASNGKLIELLIYSRGPNGHDETDKRKTIRDVESRIYRTDINKSKIPETEAGIIYAYDDITNR
jgi:prepilin-type N-terminal cleavage/methylation domain-containing protein